jgi:hypothetical protein
MPGFLKERNGMHEKEINKLIWQGIVLLIAYYILGFLIDYLVWGVISMVVLRVYQEYQKRK